MPSSNVLASVNNLSKKQVAGAPAVCLIILKMEITGLAVNRVSKYFEVGFIA